MAAIFCYQRIRVPIHLQGTQAISDQGHLTVGGCDTVALAAEFGTPLYVLDEDALRGNLNRYRTAFEQAYPRCRCYFAGKALLNLAVVRIVDEAGWNLDVATEGELAVAVAAGLPAARIAFHGSNKSMGEVMAGLGAGIGHFVLDNQHELELLRTATAQTGKRVRVMVRCTPGVDPQTHRLIRTGQADTKFGFNITDGSALKAVAGVLDTPHLHFVGLHCHIGSQLQDAETHEQAAAIMASLTREVHAQLGARVEELNLGGGLGVRYSDADHPPTYAEFAARVSGALKAALAMDEDRLPVLGLEPGRSIAAEAGLTLYTVGAIKSVPVSEPAGRRKYVSIDGGMSDNPRPQMYGAVYSCVVANRANEPHTEVCALAGKHCETDVLVQRAHLAHVEAGDTVAVQTTGAYNSTMASNYNRMPRPAMVLVGAGKPDLIVERESLSDLLRRERVPERLARRPAANVAVN
ncbi:MAG: diaminopimelate decarboxylase [Armatimonadetes bacterium]|nr:diaminopimelate decarboxylase [Armatimonadota bacterium]MDE2207367.1 diaminopimelate decarboxylase [Armatimonadota bacterium]